MDTSSDERLTPPTERQRAIRAAILGAMLGLLLAALGRLGVDR